MKVAVLKNDIMLVPNLAKKRALMSRLTCQEVKQRSGIALQNLERKG